MQKNSIFVGVEGKIFKTCGDEKFFVLEVTPI